MKAYKILNNDWPKELNESVDIKAKVKSGVPVLKGTRYPVSQLMAELSEDQKLSEICDDCDLEQELVIKFLKGLAILFGQRIK